MIDSDNVLLLRPAEGGPKLAHDVSRRPPVGAPERDGTLWVTISDEPLVGRRVRPLCHRAREERFPGAAGAGRRRCGGRTLARRAAAGRRDAPPRPDVAVTSALDRAGVAATRAAAGQPAKELDERAELLFRELTFDQLANLGDVRPARGLEPLAALLGQHRVCDSRIARAVALLTQPSRSRPSSSRVTPDGVSWSCSARSTRRIEQWSACASVSRHW